jgi:aspartyl-tRNA(Asn)/glutamyl-tRNA(Gln) amidotransferase subunit A
MTGWERLGIGGLSQGYLSGELSPPAVLDGVLARIAALDGDLSAFVAIDVDRARRAAEAADAELKRGRWRGHLHGVPIAVKELFDVAPARDPASGT